MNNDAWDMEGSTASSVPCGCCCSFVSSKGTYWPAVFVPVVATMEMTLSVVSRRRLFCGLERAFIWYALMRSELDVAGENDDVFTIPRSFNGTERKNRCLLTRRNSCYEWKWCDEGVVLLNDGLSLNVVAWVL